MRAGGATRIDPESMTAGEVAGVFGVTAQSVGLWFSRKGCPRNERTRRYCLRDVIAWRVEQAVAKAKGPDAELDSAKGSPATERWKEARAAREEIKLAQDLRDLIPRVVCHEIMGSHARLLSQASERVRRSLPAPHGDQAADIYEEAIDDAASLARGVLLGK